MFCNCSSLISLDLSNFDTSQVKETDGMFSGCSSLDSLDLSNFDTSQVMQMDYMFSGCSSLTSLNLTNFNTSQVTLMDSMFMNCYSLTSLDLSNFDTLQVMQMDYMFSGCSSLTSLNLSNFDTSQVVKMDSMFDNCSSLTSLNLSNFDTSMVENMTNMFNGCSNLEYINFNNFDENSLKYYENMFYNVPENIVISMNESNTQKILNEIKNIACYTLASTDVWKFKQKKIINDSTNQCIESCDNSSQYKYEYNGKCYENCENGFLYEDNNRINKCKCELEECLLCPNVALNKGLCTECNFNYYPKENDQLNIGEYIKCYKEPEGFYLDNNIYKQCYYTCKTCNISGNKMIHNCIECDVNYTFEIKINNNISCYKNCSYYHYFDDEYNYHCTKNLSCPNDYPKLIEDKIECRRNDIKYIMEELLKNERNETKKMSKEEEIKYYDNLLKNIEKGFIDNYDTSKLDEGQDEHITTDKITVTFSTSQNQRNNINSNMTTIDLGECETLLRREYNISFNQTLYIKKIDIVQEVIKTTKVEYNVYCKLFGTNLIKLNLTVCGNNQISLFTPFVISDNIDKYNSSSGYYNDICYTTTSEDGTDITLKDRQKNYINGDKIVCQEDCEFTEYNFETSKAKCSCKVKETPSSIVNMNIDKTKLLDNFINIKNFANFNFLVCYKRLLCKTGIRYNIGSYISLAIIIVHIITLFIFYINQYDSLKNKIQDIKFIPSRNENKEEIITVNDNTKKTLNSNLKINKIRKKIKIKKKIKRFHPIKNMEKILFDLKDEEYNSLPYNLAIAYDKRTYCEFYASLLKTKHNLISSFFNNNDYNSKIIKIDLFFIGFAIEYSVNALFYNDDTMHKIYKSKGDFDFKTQLPIMIYSTLISMILNAPLNFFGLSSDDIISFKQEQTKLNFIQNINNLKKRLFIKFILFFIISFFLLVFLWYYISMFCVIYKNTQIHLLNDTLMSFGLSLLFPFGLYLLPGIFRKISLSDKERKRKLLYDFSKVFQFF